MNPENLKNKGTYQEQSDSGKLCGKGKSQLVRVLAGANELGAGARDEDQSEKLSQARKLKNQDYTSERMMSHGGHKQATHHNTATHRNRRIATGSIGDPVICFIG